MEPPSKSQTELRDKIREKPNDWTLWRAVDEVIAEVNRMLRGWGGYFHYANSTRVFDRMNHSVANRLPRRLWRRGGCRRGVWTTPPMAGFRERLGLCRLPTTAAWGKPSR